MIDKKKGEWRGEGREEGSVGEECSGWEWGEKRGRGVYGEEIRGKKMRGRNEDNEIWNVICETSEIRTFLMQSLILS